MRRTPALIVGGGPAGAAAAIALAGRGGSPLLLERSTGAHDVVCGGFMGWDALAALERLGIDVEALGAQRIDNLLLVAGERSALLALPRAAAGLSRQKLDAALLACAEDRGARVERGVTVRSIDAATRTALLADGREIAADALFLATGKYELRGAQRSASPGDDPPVGLRMRLEATPRLSRALQNRVELFLFDRGYAGMLLQEDGTVNFCLTAARSRLAAAGGSAERLVVELAAECPTLADRLGDMVGAGSWSSIARVPYGWRAETTTDGIFRLGDQVAVIASVVGDGIAIALESARMASEHYFERGAAAAAGYQRSFARHVDWPVRIAGWLRATVETPRGARVLMPVVDLLPALARSVIRATRVGGY